MRHFSIDICGLYHNNSGVCIAALSILPSSKGKFCLAIKKDCSGHFKEGIYHYCSVEEGGEEGNAVMSMTEV